MLYRLGQDHADVVLVTVEQPSDAERGIGAEMRDHLPRELRMGQGLRCLLSEPGDDRYASISENQ